LKHETRGAKIFEICGPVARRQKLRGRLVGLALNRETELQRRRQDVRSAIMEDVEA
jgi:hypothetical protein